MFKHRFIGLCVGPCWVPGAALRLPSSCGSGPAPAALLLLGLQGAQCQQWQCPSFVSPRQVESSSTRDRTHVPCIGRRILNRWAIREVPGWELVDSDLWKYITSFLCPDVTFLFFFPSPFPPLETTQFFSCFLVAPFSSFSLCVFTCGLLLLLFFPFCVEQIVEDIQHFLCSALQFRPLAKSILIAFDQEEGSSVFLSRKH